MAVQKGLNLGIILFIVSEALFFLAIFWAFFHSALTPTVELGAQWPPIGISPVNPFELPLLNTVILLSSAATITYAHHSLIFGERIGALYGSIVTGALAVIFTVFQGIEYYVSSFTISDGAFGSSFFFGTGFHGLTISVAHCIYIFLYLNQINFCGSADNNINSKENKDLSIVHPIHGNYYLDKRFIEWFVGFTDAEGNFYIKLTALKDNTFKSVQFTFQIGLHKDEIKVLEYIMNTLKCGHISKSGDKVNFFVNDQYSLLNVIIPLFDYVNLNSSKYHHYIAFRKAVMLIKDKRHLLKEGKLEIIEHKNLMQGMSGKWIPSSIGEKINITKYWLAGFIDGEGTFSTNKYVPRFKLENHIKELELYNQINKFIGIDKLLYSSDRVNREETNPTIILEINKIKELKEIIIPLMYDNEKLLLNTLKSQDFLLWLNLVDIYYKGYHTTLEGKYVFDLIKSIINKYRLTTNKHGLKECISITEIEKLLNKLYLSESPYILKKGVRYHRDTDKLVSESNQIVSIDEENVAIVYDSMTDAAKSLNISRKKIKECLTTGEAYKGYKFVFK